MKKKLAPLIFILCWTTLSSSIFAGQYPRDILQTYIIEKTQDSVITFPLSVRFLSVCCGVPSDAPMRKQIGNFKKKYRISKIEATRIGPLGREGEYDLAFELKGWSTARKRDFIKKMKSATNQMKDKGKAMVELEINYDRSRLPARLSFEKVEY